MSTDARTHFSTAGGIVALLVSVLGAPLAWFANLEASYALVSSECGRSSTTTLHLVSVAALVAAAAAGLVAWRSWRRAGAGWPDDAGGTIPSSRFVGALGVLMSGLFALVIVAQGITSLVVGPCQ